MALFNAPKQRKTKPVPASHRRELGGWKEDPFEFNTRNGYCLFAFKGVVLEKKDGTYSVARQIKIKGFPEESLKQLEGAFNSGVVIGNIINLALEHVDPERHTAVRMQYRNWCCPKCGTHALFSSKDVFIVYKYSADEWGQDVKTDTGRREIVCHHCFKKVDVNDVDFVGDEVMR